MVILIRQAVIQFVTEDFFYSENDRTYMFGTKEIESLGYYTGDMMEQAAGSMAYLRGDSDYANHVDREEVSDRRIEEGSGRYSAGNR